MKQREARLNVLIPSRMRWEGRWIPATVHNISPHGMALRLPSPPRPGTYVEVELGQISVAARTVWAADQSCGLQSREAFDLTAVNAARPAGSAVRVSRLPVTPGNLSRRKPSLQEQEDRSRRLAAQFQFLTFAVVICVAASGLGWEVYQTLSAPMQNVNAAFELAHR